MDTEFDLSPDADPVPDIAWDIRREGHIWDNTIARPRRRLAPGKIEMIFGQLFCTETDRVIVLALLLENVGVDKAVRLGSPDVWRSAVADLPEEEPGTGSARLLLGESVSDTEDEVIVSSV